MSKDVFDIRNLIQPKTAGGIGQFVTAASDGVVRVSDISVGVGMIEASVVSVAAR